MSKNPRGTPTARRHDVLLWLAPLIALAGFLSYWGYFVRWPWLRDTGLLNLALLLLAVGLSGLALWRAWPRGAWRRIAAAAGLLVATTLTGLFIAYCYFLSYGLPPGDGVTAVGEPLPALTLASHDGTPVALQQASRGPLLLVFYRGFW